MLGCRGCPDGREGCRLVGQLAGGLVPYGSLSAVAERRSTSERPTVGRLKDQCANEDEDSDKGTGGQRDAMAQATADGGEPRAVAKRMAVRARRGALAAAVGMLTQCGETARIREPCNAAAGVQDDARMRPTAASGAARAATARLAMQARRDTPAAAVGAVMRCGGTARILRLHNAAAGVQGDAWMQTKAGSGAARATTARYWGRRRDAIPPLRWSVRRGGAEARLASPGKHYQCSSRNAARCRGGRDRWQR